MLLDFNSLYPSIIQEYNLCFSTISNDIDYDSYIDNKENILNDKNSILPNILNDLVKKRKSVKNQIKKEIKDTKNKTESEIQSKVNVLEINQKALKLTANSL